MVSESQAIREFGCCRRGRNWTGSDANEQVVELLNGGIAPQSIHDALFMGASECIFRHSWFTRWRVGLVACLLQVSPIPNYPSKRLLGVCACDSLAEVHWKTGKLEKAIELYNAAIELDPDGPIGDNACEMLKKIRADQDK